MAGIDLTTAQTQLNAYVAAEIAVLGGQLYKIGDRELRRADLAEIRAGIDYWDKRVKYLNARASGRGRVIVPRPSSTF
jgi:hypothetical protein